MTTDAAKAAKAKYDAKTAKYYSLKLNRNTDQDIISKLEQQESVQGYLKKLIRNDMRGGIAMATYKIKPEYLDLWEGGDTPSDPDRIITEDELERLAADWEKPVDELKEQLIPQD